MCVEAEEAAKLSNTSGDLLVQCYRVLLHHWDFGTGQVLVRYSQNLELKRTADGLDVSSYVDEILSSEDMQNGLCRDLECGSAWTKACIEV